MIRVDNLNQRTEKSWCLWNSRFVWDPRSHRLQSKLPLHLPGAQTETLEPLWDA